MESFVKEPTIDWLHSARVRNPDDSISSTGNNWFILTLIVYLNAFYKCR